MGPTNTQSRYRPPPPGNAPPPPNHGMMGGQQQQYNNTQQPQQSYYSASNNQPTQQQSYYAQSNNTQSQQTRQQQQPSRTAIPGSNQSYASRSAAAYTSPQQQNNYSQHNGSQHSGSGNFTNNASNHSNNSTNNNQQTKQQTTTTKSPQTNIHNEIATAEQSRLLNAATQKITEYSYQMQRSIESNDVVSTLDKASLLLEELGDPNHGLHHKGGTGNRSGPGGGVVNPNQYPGGAGGVPPLGNYGDRPYVGNTPYGGNNNGWITPLTPKNYYELHMRAMDEMPVLEEYLLSLCHTPNATSHGGATNYNNQQLQSSSPYTSKILYETVQYTPRVVPRLYLQICIGSVSIRTKSKYAISVMNELSEVCKCVQCPIRGLFLRYYLLMALKDKLPDGNSLENGEEGKEESGVEIMGEGIPEETTSESVAPLTPGGANDQEDTGEEILGASAVSEPTSPPPALPPPPPPSTDGVLFEGLTDSTDAPLFADEPLSMGEEKTQPTPPVVESPPTTTPNITEPSTTTTTKRDEEPTKEGTVVDSYEFILRNLIEMNRLWIRIKHMPGDRTKETKRRREKERNDLRILVGSNLNRLSQLDGISAHTYGSTILPRILNEIASCRDPLAQAYLMDCIIQVFPDEYHLETLEVFLGVCPRLREKVNVRTILKNMMERLLHYFEEENLSNDEVDTNDVKQAMAMHSFEMFEACIQRVFEARGLNIPPRDVVRFQGCLLNYALKIAPHDTDLITRCISNCAKELGTLQEQKRASMMGQGIVLGGGTKKSMELDMCNVAIAELEKLLSVPLDSMGLKVLEMHDFSMLLAFLPWENRRQVAVSMIKSVIAVGNDKEKKVKDVNQLEQLFTILSPLLRDEGMAAPVMHTSESHEGAGGSLISRTANLMGTLGISPSANDDIFGGGGNDFNAQQGGQSSGVDATKLAQFHEEQELVAKLVHVLDNEDTDVAYQMLNLVRRHVQPGGAARITITLPPIVFAALDLLRRIQKLEFPDPEVEKKEEEETKVNDEPKVKEPKVEEPKSVKEDEKETEEVSESVDVDETKDQPSEEKATVSSDETKEEESHIGEVVDKDESSAEKDTEPEKEESVEESPPEDIKKEQTATDQSPPDVMTEDEEVINMRGGGLEADFTKSVNCRKVLVFLQKTVAMLAPSNPELAFKLYLEIAVATDSLAHSTQQHYASSSAEFTSIAYDFLTQAFLVYEDEISESNAQIRAITSIVGSLLSCKTFEKTDYEALITKTAQYSAKLLKKPDQCRMVCLCSRLFYVGGKDDVNIYRNPQRVLECLQRGLKIADACSMSSSSNVQLFVEILDYYVYYYEIENPSITDKFVSGLIALINEHFDSIGITGSTAIAETRAYYEQILDQIRRKKIEDATKERFSLIVC